MLFSKIFKRYGCHKLSLTPLGLQGLKIHEKHIQYLWVPQQHVRFNLSVIALLLTACVKKLILQIPPLLSYASIFC